MSEDLIEKIDGIRNVLKKWSSDKITDKVRK